MMSSPSPHPLMTETDAPTAGAKEAEAELALSVCRKLRTKMAFLPLRNAEGDPLYWQRGDGGTAVYWCLRTMECAGPDGGLAHATLCCGDRECYEPLTS
jgi:hypothetical protein